jgi:hypothetical protein
MIFEPMVCSAQTVHLSCVEIDTIPQTDLNELPLDLHHQGVPSSVCKAILEPMVHSAQTVNLSCTEINTISKQTKTTFHLTHIT